MLYLNYRMHCILMSRIWFCNGCKWVQIHISCFYHASIDSRLRCLSDPSKSVVIPITSYMTFIRNSQEDDQDYQTNTIFRFLTDTNHFIALHAITESKENIRANLFSAFLHCLLYDSINLPLWSTAAFPAHQGNRSSERELKQLKWP